MTYAEKLRDPRWQRKRLEILQRDNWTCHDCGDTNKELQVHHVFYAKRDPWDYPNESYQTLCCDCHELRQEVTDSLVEEIRMSLKDVPVNEIAASSFGLFGRPQKTASEGSLGIYLAGKIAHTDWRHEVVSELRSAEPMGICWSGVDGEFPIRLERSILGKHSYVGPFFVACDHGCFHGPNSHGAQCIDRHSGHLPEDRSEVHVRALAGIRRCDLFFAFVDSTECYGTLFEIGYAQAIGRRTVILAKRGLNDLWFSLIPSERCTVVYFEGEADPAKFIIDFLKKESHGIAK